MDKKAEYYCKTMLEYFLWFYNWRIHNHHCRLILTSLMKQDQLGKMLLKLKIHKIQFHNAIARYILEPAIIFIAYYITTYHTRKHNIHNKKYRFITRNTDSQQEIQIHNQKPIHNQKQALLPFWERSAKHHHTQTWRTAIVR